MRKFLSLVLALVMMMSLVTINAGAKEFTDGKDITYDEAVDVISTVKVVDGYANGSFNPGGNLTRGAAAKIICNLILGPTTAAELHADTAPYRDVPVSHDFAGYIAYCQKEGIISGYADGSFRPGGTLTGYAFMKMLLGALGYDAEIEQYTGPNWSINVAKRAIGIGLNKGLEKTFNGVDYITREEACLYAFNTLQADLVQYDSRITTTINGAQVTVGNSQAESRKWDSQATRVNNIREDNIVQFAEEYFNKLEKKYDDDEFMRPAYTWIYDKEEIGTYVDWELLVEEYTTAVSVRDLYDVIGSNLLNDADMEFTYYVNGVEPIQNSGLPAWVAAGDGSDNLTKSGDKTNSVALRRSNQNDAGISDDGVLTQVFIDKDQEEITVTSIDTWLAKGGADYNESKEGAPLHVWNIEDTDTNKTYNVDVTDVPEIEDVKEDEFYLVSISFKDDVDNGEIVSIWEPEILSDSAVTKFSLPDASSDRVPTKVTVAGTEYKQARQGNYDPKALYDYNETLLTDRAYNVILDQYSYMIGIELEEGAKNYVFITGFDRPVSNLSVQTADAASIFLDGTMQAMKVNVSATDKNIENARKDVNKDAGKYYFLKWQDMVNLEPTGYDGFYALNRWFTYTVNDAGVYTLKPASNMAIHNYGASTEETIKTANLYFDDNVMMNAIDATADGKANYENPYYGLNSGAKQITTHFGAGSAPEGTTTVNTDGKYTYDVTPNTRVYGNDDSVYLTVGVGNVDTNDQEGAITEVTGVYTGVQNVEIEIETDGTGKNEDRPLEEGEIFAVYDDDHYIIGAVTNGEGKGGNATIAYITSSVKSERIEDGYYYWEFDAILDGTEQTLTAKTKYEDIFTDVINGEAYAGGYEDYVAGSSVRQNNGYDWNAYDGLVELRFDADEKYVTAAKPVVEKDIYSYYGNRTAANKNSESPYRGNNSITSADNDAFVNFQTGNARLKIEDAKAYRIGVIGTKNVQSDGYHTWNDGTVAHHYDSAPTELTLAGRTLYVTPQNGDKTYVDEGLALQTDAKAVVIQRENGKWKTREFSTVKSALAQIVDSDEGTAGLQYNGEVIAAMGNNGAAKWVVFVSYNNLVSGGGNVPVQGNRVSHVVVEYVDEDGPDTTIASGGKEYTAFKLFNTTPGKTYTVTLHVTVGGLTTTRTKTVKATSTDYVANSIANGAFYGKLDGGTSVTLVCEDGVATDVVPVLDRTNATTIANTSPRTAPTFS